MEWIEVSARSVEEAVELALDRLGVVESELEYEIIDEPRAGLFGRLGRADARIRARVKPLSREKPADRQRRRRGRSADGRSGNGSTRGSSAGRSGGTRSARSGGSSAPGGASTSGEGSAARSGSRRGRRGGRQRSARPAPEGPLALDGPDEISEAEEQVDAVPVSEQAEMAATFVDELIRSMGLSASIATDVGEDDVMIRVEGDQLGVLVGPHGATLQAMEEVVRAVVQHQSGGHSARIRLDVSGYRERRREALAAFATKVAAEVKQAGAPRALEPMPSPDRKVVHDTIAEIEGVSTTSEGEEPRRRVVISPE